MLLCWRSTEDCIWVRLKFLELKIFLSYKYRHKCSTMHTCHCQRRSLNLAGSSVIIRARFPYSLWHAPMVQTLQKRYNLSLVIIRLTTARDIAHLSEPQKPRGLSYNYRKNLVINCSTAISVLLRSFEKDSNASEMVIVQENKLSFSFYSASLYDQ